MILDFENLKVNDERLKCVFVGKYGKEKESLKKSELKTKL